jgi:electron transport complex protein RnfD
MSLLWQSSPHTHARLGTAQIMQLVLLATLPGVAALVWFFGFGVLVNIVLACAFALAFEAIAMRLRGRPALFYLRDCSALVTATLLAISMPPYAPWWLILIGMFAAIVLAKQLYGGLGYNPFNPAMVGYVVLLISFPVEMTRWLAPAGLDAAPGLGLAEGLQKSFGLLGAERLDAVTAATPLDLFRASEGVLMADLWAGSEQFGRFGGYGWEWVNAGFLVGGLYLLYRRVFTWHAPLSMLASITLLSLLFYDGGSSASGGSPLFHLFTGATMFGAFFIVTDPVSSAVSTRGRIVYGALIGALVYIIRVWGNYPDAVAFAVLLLNFAAPFIDHYTQPRTYGHARGRS